MLKAYHCSYRWYGRFGAYHDIDAIVIANSEREAIGIALEKEPTTLGKDWAAEEIDCSSIAYFPVYEVDH